MPASSEIASKLNRSCKSKREKMRNAVRNDRPDRGAAINAARKAAAPDEDSHEISNTAGSGRGLATMGGVRTTCKSSPGTGYRQDRESGFLLTDGMPQIAMRAASSRKG